MAEYTINSFYDEGFPKDWKQIASVDESEPYEIDQTTIWQTPTGYALAVASGCSCWDGEWSVTEFATLDDIFDSFDTTDYAYNPSLKGIEALKEQIVDYLGG
jgi:hypothetical protein